MTIDAFEQIRVQEKRRCNALLAGDFDALGTIVADPLVHVHASGKVENRAGYLSTMRDKVEFVEIERGELSFLDLGEVVVTTGPLKQILRVKEADRIQTMRAVTTQVWRFAEGCWRQVSFQATNAA